MALSGSNFSGYQVSSNVLDSMKEAAGNYMPDYGNWRYKLKQPKPEEETPPELTPPESEPTVQTDSYNNPEIKSEYYVEGTPETTESETYTYNMMYDDLIAGTWSGDDGTVYSPEDAERMVQEARDSNIAQFGTHNPTAEGKANNVVTTTIPGTEGHWEEIIVDPGGAGSITRTFDGDGNLISEEVEGTPLAEWNVGNVQRIEDSTIGDAYASHMNQGIASMPQPYVDPFAGVDQFLSNQLSKFDETGTSAPKSFHNNVERMAHDLRDNVFFKGGENPAEVKGNESQAFSMLNSIGSSFKASVGPEGSISVLAEVVRDDLLSKSTTKQEKMLIGHLLQMDKVQPRLDDKNNVVYMVPMPAQGSAFAQGVGLVQQEEMMVPMTKNDIDNLITKRTVPYTVAKEFADARPSFYEAGRKNQAWDKDAVIMRNMRMIKENSKTRSDASDRFASMLLDPYLFSPTPQIELILDAIEPGLSQKIDTQQFVMEAMNNDDARHELEVKFANALEKMGRESYLTGKAEYDAVMSKNKPSMSPEELIAKYS